MSKILFLQASSRHLSVSWKSQSERDDDDDEFISHNNPVLSNSVLLFSAVLVLSSGPLCRGSIYAWFLQKDMRVSLGCAALLLSQTVSG